MQVYIYIYLYILLTQYSQYVAEPYTPYTHYTHYTHYMPQTDYMSITYMFSLPLYLHMCIYIYTLYTQ